MPNYNKQPNRNDENLDEVFEKEIKETVHAVGDAVQTVVTAVSSGVKDGLQEGAKRAATAASEYTENAKRQAQNNGAAPYNSQTANNVGYNYATNYRRNGPEYINNTTTFFGGFFGKKKSDYAKKAKSASDDAGGTLLACGILLAIAATIGGGVAPVVLEVIAAWLGVTSIGSFLRSGRYKRIATYMQVMGDRTNCAISELASATGKSEADTVKFIRKQLANNTFKDVFITPDNKRLFTSETAYNIYVDSLEQNYKKQQEEQRAAEQPAEPEKPKTVLDECKEFYSELKHQNELIDDGAVTEQVDKMEKHMQTIIAYLEKNPAKAPRVKRFTSYYLPTTVKLLKTYNDVEPTSEENTVAANIQNDIVGILYSINSAFATLENTLMEDTAMNVSSEIAAMQAMLAQDGLTNDEFGTKKNKTQLK